MTQFDFQLLHQDYYSLASKRVNLLPGHNIILPSAFTQTVFLNTALPALNNDLNPFKDLTRSNDLAIYPGLK